MLTGKGDWETYRSHDHDFTVCAVAILSPTGSKRVKRGSQRINKPSHESKRHAPKNCGDGVDDISISRGEKTRTKDEGCFN